MKEYFNEVTLFVVVILKCLSADRVVGGPPQCFVRRYSIPDDKTSQIDKDAPSDSDESDENNVAYYNQNNGPEASNGAENGEYCTCKPVRYT